MHKPLPIWASLLVIVLITVTLEYLGNWLNPHASVPTEYTKHYAYSDDAYASLAGARAQGAPDAGRTARAARVRVRARREGSGIGVAHTVRCATLPAADAADDHTCFFPAPRTTLPHARPRTDVDEPLVVPQS